MSRAEFGAYVCTALAGYYAWADRQNFEQAVMVACRHGVRWDNLEKWHKAEGELEGYREFRAAVEGSKGPTL